MSTRNLGPLIPGAPSLTQLQALSNQGFLVDDVASDQNSTSTTFTVPSGISAVSITKYLGSSTTAAAAASTGSKFAVEGSIELYVTGSASTVAEFGVRFSQVGGSSIVIDTVLGKKLFNETNVTDVLSGFNFVTAGSFPAGSWTVAPIFRRVSGSGTVTLPQFLGADLWWKEVLI